MVPVRYESSSKNNNEDTLLLLLTLDPDGNKLISEMMNLQGNIWAASLIELLR